MNSSSPCLVAEIQEMTCIKQLGLSTQACLCWHATKWASDVVWHQPIPRNLSWASKEACNPCRHRLGDVGAWCCLHWGVLQLRLAALCSHLYRRWCAPSFHWLPTARQERSRASHGTCRLCTAQGTSCTVHLSSRPAVLCLQQTCCTICRVDHKAVSTGQHEMGGQHGAHRS